ncbi:MAG: hypothetical protein ACJAZ3_000968 [Sphingobacteriales bacterium]
MRQKNYLSGELLLHTFLGYFYIVILHMIVLFFQSIWSQILTFFAVLFTGKYPKAGHELITEFIRWSYRFHLYSALMTDKYPPFSLK